MQVPAPWPNAYWVVPGLLLAGEYPGTKYDVEARTKLEPLLDAGIRVFVDLTEAHELEPYEEVVRDLGAERGVAVEYRRIPVPDVSVPRSRETMVEILDALDDAIAGGRPVLVHCWGGIGRTGTAVGCFLVRRGASGEEALRRVAELFRGMEKSRGRRSPETREQEAYVRDWTEDATGTEGEE